MRIRTEKEKRERRDERRRGHGLECFCVKGVAVLVLLISVFLAYNSLRYTEWTPDFLEIVEQFPDSPLGNLAFFGAFLAFLSVIRFFSRKRQESAEKVLRIAVCCTVIYALVFSVYWVSVALVQPYADGWFCCAMADFINIGEYGVLEPAGYVGTYPQQTGLVFVLQMIYRLFGSMNWVPFQYLNALCMPLLVYAGYRIAWFVFEKNEICFYYLILIVAYLPLWMYVPFVYGEIISITFSLVVLWQTLRFCRTQRVSSLAWGGLAAGIAYQLRMSSLIMVIASAIVLLVYAYRASALTVAVKSLALIGAMFLGIICLELGVKGYYQSISGVEIGSGIPRTALIMMGLQDTEKGPGRYTGESIDLYLESDCDVQAVDDYCTKAVKERLAELAQGGALDFFYRKLETQWNQPDCLAYFETDNFDQVSETAPWLTSRVYTGSGKAVIRLWMDRFQFMIYFSVMILMGGALLFCKSDLPSQVAAITIIGGFLFSIMWEAMSRYVLPYIVLMVILAGGGMYCLQEALWRLCGYIRQKRNAE